MTENDRVSLCNGSGKPVNLLVTQYEPRTVNLAGAFVPAKSVYDTGRGNADPLAPNAKVTVSPNLDGWGFGTAGGYNAVWLDLAVDKSAASGYLAVGPAGSFGTSALNFTKGVSVAHGQIADRGAVITNVSSGITNLSTLITGYFHD